MLHGVVVPLQERYRNTATIVNNGIIQSVSLRSELQPQPAVHEDLDPSGHARTTYRCFCGEVVNRYSNCEEARFRIGSLVVYKEPSRKRKRDVQRPREQAGHVVGFTHKKISVHLLVVGQQNKNIHFKSKFCNFSPWTGSEEEILTKMLRNASGKVFVTSCASFTFGDVRFDGPCELDCGDGPLESLPDVSSEPVVREKPKHREKRKATAGGRSRNTPARGGPRTSPPNTLTITSFFTPREEEKDEVADARARAD